MPNTLYKLKPLNQTPIDMTGSDVNANRARQRRSLLDQLPKCSRSFIIPLGLVIKILDLFIINLYVLIVPVAFRSFPTSRLRFFVAGAFYSTPSAYATEAFHAIPQMAHPL